MDILNMGAELDKIMIYGSVGLLLFVVFWIYIRKQRKESKQVDEKIKVAKEEGLFEPVSLHPVVDVNSCIKSGACILACPEHDILGIRNGKATVINASRCVGHGACFHACPTQAISLFMGTEKRGVDLPHVNQNFESNVPGIFIAGEMGGMGLIKNAVEQGKQAIVNLAKGIKSKHQSEYDLVVIGAGPAGISASLQARKMGLKTITLEQDTLGGTVYTFPRQKIVMTSPMDLPLHGKAKLYETNKKELLDLWTEVLEKNKIEIREKKKAEEITVTDGGFIVKIKTGETLSAQKVLLAIGRRGTPRKLGIPREDSEKVAYRLLEPELIHNKKIVVVGGGDSAIESALLLMHENEVTLSYRKDKFSRLKPKNNEKIIEAISKNKISVVLNSNLISIEENSITLQLNAAGGDLKLGNDLVYIFAGGELPTDFLQKAGIKISTKFGEAILTHKK
ncbi:NAD(P)-binding domain-containing protein [Prolixibacteraceae bacterium Z1-6]|uniref:NAD(P)-binding domain-containing protein n=1 Tax=Draconibacterium aestuarii TaxID=2998507 RepID=A0A9X3J526_9BACT|nr:NAD(P)-binding domain-containing protein [Prolixibacteraceae bacterium Z1-6]